MPGGLLYSEGDSVTLTWTPSDVLSSEIAGQNDYLVTMEVYAYILGEWSIFEEIDTSVVNTGSIDILEIRSMPEGTDPIVPISFHIKAEDSLNLEDYIRPVVQAGQAGIWSPVAYVITDSEYVAADYCIQFVEEQLFSGAELLQNTIPCPCRTNQARVGNSMFLEQRTYLAIQMRQLFYPSASTCFLSTVVG